jgi:hypothetical protein
MQWRVAARGQSGADESSSPPSKTRRALGQRSPEYLEMDFSRHALATSLCSAVGELR